MVGLIAFGLVAFSSNSNRSSKSLDEIVTVRQAVSNLSAELGMQVVVPTTLGRHMVFLQTHGQPAKVALETIATCLHGTVMREGNHLSIKRSEQDLDKLRREQIRGRAQNLQSCFAELAKFKELNLKGRSLTVAISEEIQDHARQWKEVIAHQRDELGPHDGREFMPVHVLLENLIRRLGPEEIASKSVSHPEVYEDEPAADELALPACDDLLQQYNDSMSELRLSKPTQQIQDMARNAGVGSSDGFKSWLSSDSVAKHMRLRVQTDSDRLLISLECFDSQGARCDGTSVDGLPDAMHSIRSFSPVERSFATKKGSRMVAISDEASNACRQVNYDPVKLPEWIRDPETHDPLNVFVRPILAQVAAEETSSCVVIDVSDDLFYLASFCVKGGDANVDEYLDLMSKWAHYEHLNQGVAAIWRPKYFDQAEAQQADRKALARYAKSYASFGGRECLAQARLYREAGASVGTLTRWFSAFYSGKWQESVDLTDCFFRLIGGISPTDWEALRSGRALTAMDLGVTPELQELLREDQVKSESVQNLADIFRHPAELFRGDVLDKAVIEVHEEPHTLLRYWDLVGSSELEGSWLEPGSLSVKGHVRYGGRPIPDFLTTRDAFDAALGKYNYRTATTVRTTIVVRLPGKCFVERSLPQQINKVSSVLQFGDLPKEVRDSIWNEACVKAKSRYEGMRHFGSEGSSSGLDATPPQPK